MEVPVAPYRAKQALREGREIALPKLNFGVRWAASTKAWPL
jgi:hypothetical protein